MIKRTFLAAAISTLSTVAAASQWVEPDDVALRHNIQLLSDYGVLRIPTTTWPLRWSNIQQALGPLPDNADPLVQYAYQQLQQALTHYQHRQSRLSGTFATTVGHNQPLLQGFGEAPRSESHTQVTIAGNTRGIEGRFAYSIASNSPPAPHQYDHSYLGVTPGNWSVGVDLLDRWWGPGWDGSLILSNNPHPIPTLSLQRDHTLPFDNKLLGWLGPWDLNIRLGQFEQERSVSRCQFFAARFVFLPLSGLEIGLSRASQWGGEGRQNDVNAFKNMLLGHDNVNDNVSQGDEPGNQLGGYDLRWSLPSLRTAVYGQLIGEDESVMLPSDKMQVYGAEYWGLAGRQSYRLYFEYANTTTYRDIIGGAPGYNTAYNHHIFTDGYRYYGDTLGHSADSDSLIRTFGLITTNTNGWRSHFLYRNGVINRDNNGKNLISEGQKTELQEWLLQIGKEVNSELDSFLQFGGSLRDKASHTHYEKIIRFGIKFNL